MVPITFLLADALDIDPIPLVLIEIFASNIGGTATLIGDPPNILIAGRDRPLLQRVHREPRADRRGDAARRGHAGAVPRVPVAIGDRAGGPRAGHGARPRLGRSRTPTSCAGRCRSCFLTIVGVLRPQAAAPRAGHGRPGRRHDHAARQPAVDGEGARRHRVAAVLLRDVRHGRRAGGDRRIQEVADGIADGDRREPERRAVRDPWVSASRRGSSTTSRSPRR